MTVEISDVEGILGRELTDAENDRVDRLVELAEGLVEGALPGFSVATGTETATVDPGDPSTVWTPRYPVSDLTTLEVDGSEVDTTWYRWNVKGRIRLVSSYPINGWELNFPSLGNVVTLTYGYGLDPAPVDVALTVAAMVAGALRQQATNAGGVQSESIDGYSVSFGDYSARAAAAGMTVPAGALSRWKRNRQLSVPLVGG